MVLKRFVARNIRPITSLAWNQYIGDQLFCELEGGPIPVHEPGQVRIEPAAPDVVRPRLPDANLAQPMHVSTKVG